MDITMRATYEAVQIEHEQRIRDGERYRRANEARQYAKRHSAAPHERRSVFFRFPFGRPSEA